MLAVKPPGPGIFFVTNFLIINSLSCLVIGISNYLFISDCVFLLESVFVICVFLVCLDPYKYILFALSVIVDIY